MRTKILIAATVMTLAGSAFAQEGDFPSAPNLSTKSRAEVKAELVAAVRAGAVGAGEASPTPVPASTLTRAQVRAETLEAMRLGLVGSSYEADIRVPTPAELESIRLAGLRAVEHGAE